MDWDVIEPRIKNIIHETIRQTLKEEVLRVTEISDQRIALSFAQCKAHQIFSDKDIERSFFDIFKKFEQHLEAHKKREVTVKWLIGILITVICSTIGFLTTALKHK
ncbi:hypothetical protein KSU1_C1506 [Candidatus Jettenia caeni]|uniref:Uncharacterized protein n=1 Tax=Candidatus Jettenia caeni TaxID=247490 RepID=I3IN07_9BACT|nr:hypothetical protein [Candidatus Jettenia sp. AMX1]MDL1938479.1 hypothetical protein [Candidatus Jettenia sp. AMX1]GAB63102.1 hypothetical protein KSU1_C1506 [Candidatus Jettenia caeni]GJQ44261.1 MAG: hypothetical protein JETCAE04_00150 [Candidatus Jettenia caeni]